MFRFKKKGPLAVVSIDTRHTRKKERYVPHTNSAFSFSLQGSLFLFFLLIADANEEPTELLECTFISPRMRRHSVGWWFTFDQHGHSTIIHTSSSSGFMFRFALFYSLSLFFNSKRIKWKKTNKTNAFQNKNGGRRITWKRLSRLSSFVVHIQVGKVKVGDDHQRADACKRGQGRKEVFIFKKK